MRKRGWWCWRRCRWKSWLWWVGWGGYEYSFWHHTKELQGLLFQCHRLWSRDRLNSMNLFVFEIFFHNTDANFLGHIYLKICVFLISLSFPLYAIRLLVDKLSNLPQRTSSNWQSCCEFQVNVCASKITSDGFRPVKSSNTHFWSYRGHVKPPLFQDLACFTSMTSLHMCTSSPVRMPNAHVSFLIYRNLSLSLYSFQLYIFVDKLL